MTAVVNNEGFLAFLQISGDLVEIPGVLPGEFE